MTVRAVHQFVPSLVPRDAVSVHALEARGVLRSMGFESEIFVKETRAEMVPESRFYRSYESTGSDVLIYQASTGSAVADYLMDRTEPLIVNYHNVTPAAFFAPWEPHTAVELEVGRRQIAELSGRATLGLAVSSFNERDLVAMGYARTAVAPVLIDPSTLGREPDPAALDRLRRARDGADVVVLFVGRIAPNKAQHDLVKALATYRHLYGDRARLHLVGSAASPRYQRALRGLVSAQGLDDVVDFPGSVTDGELAAYYATADVFMSASDHEGFCVPIVEAMHHGLPVVAYGAGAIPETVADGGLVLSEKDPSTLAAAMHRLAGDATLRKRLSAAGRARVGVLGIEHARERFRSVVAETLALVAA